MPDVGVLQLKISADASSASRSLKTLKDKLSEINTLAGNFNVGNVSTQIESIVNTVKGDKGVSTAVKNLGTLLNAISAFSKVTKIGLSKEQLDSLESLQTVANGFKLGAAGVQLNQMRIAFSEQWNTENINTAVTAMEDIASSAEKLMSSGAGTSISSTATALKEYSEAINELKASLGDGVNIPTAVTAGQGQGFVTLGLASAQGMSEGIAEGTGEVSSAAKELADAARDATANELEIHSPSRVFKELGHQAAEGFAIGFAEASKRVTEVASDIKGSAAEIGAAAKDQLSETDISDVVKQVDDAAKYMGLSDRDIVGEAKRTADETVAATSSITDGTAKWYEDWIARTRQALDEWRTMLEEETSKKSPDKERVSDLKYAVNIQKDKLESITREYNAYMEKLNNPPKTDDFSDKLEREAVSVRNLALNAGELSKQLQGLYGEQQKWAAIAEVSSNTGISEGAISYHLRELRDSGAFNTAEEATEAVKDAKEASTAMTEMARSTEGARSSLAETGKQMKQTGEDAKSLKDRFMEVVFGAKGLDGGMKRMFPTITGLLGRFKQLVKYRVLRAIIKQISEGFREGYENYYHYSEAIGSGFAPSMDSAASSLLQMKNSIGAAVAPLMQSLVPVLQTVVNWFITAVNWANQFLALMRGQSTWSRAVPTTTKAFEKTEKAAKGASSAMKDLLADWDELNIIQSQGGGGGSGTGADAMTDYLNMFEEVSEFDNRVRDVFNYIKENMGDIARLAAEVGGAILGWKVSEAFGGILGKLGGVLGTLATIALTVELTDKFGKLYTSTGDVGWFFADALTGAVGSALAWKIAKRVGGGNFALEAGGFTLMLSGLVNLQNGISAGMQGKMAEFGMLSILSAAEAGVGTALVAKGLNLTTAFSFGLGFAAAIATVAIAIGAKIQMTKDNVEWGTVTLTREEIEKFVSQRMFNGLDVTATVNKINTDVSNVTINKKAIQDALAAVRIPLNMIRLGIDKEDSYEQLKKQIFGDEEGGTQGLISQIQTYAESNVQELKTAFSMVPVINNAGTDVSGKYLTSGIEGWSQVQRYMNWLGGELGKELSKGFTEDGIAKFDEDAVREMTEKIRRISEIITGSQAQAAAQSDLRLGLSELGLGDLDQSSVDQVIALFGNYQSQLRDAYENIYKDAAGQFLVLANYYREQGNEALADEYETQYRELMSMLPESVDNAVKNASGSGMEMIYEFLHSKFGDVFNRLMLNLDDGGSGVLRQILLSKFTPTAGDAEKSKKEFNNALLSIYGGENMFLAKLLQNMPGISMVDLITFGMNENEKNEAINNLKEMVTSLYGEELTDTLFPKVTVDVPTDINPVPDMEGNPKNANPNKSDLTDQVSVPAPDLKDYINALDAMARQTKSAVDYVKSELNSINGMSVDVRVHAPSNNGGGFSGGMKYYQRAEGGFVRSGDLVMANENGQFEMMGKFGHQPAVANNEQIVTGISRGVSVANDGVVSALNVLIGLAQRIERKEMVAKVVPGTGLGRANQQSANMYSRVTGV